LDLTPASAEIAIFGGDAIVGHALERLLQSADHEVRFLTRAYPDMLRLLEKVNLLILAPGLNVDFREAVLGLTRSKAAKVRFPVLELSSDDQKQQTEAWRVLFWPCRIEELRQEVKAALADGLGAGQGD
jgi:hypothetical protein